MTGNATGRRESQTVEENTRVEYSPLMDGCVGGVRGGRGGGGSGGDCFAGPSSVSLTTLVVVGGGGRVSFGGDCVGVLLAALQRGGVLLLLIEGVEGRIWEREAQGVRRCCNSQDTSLQPYRRLNMLKTNKVH